MINFESGEKRKIFTPNLQKILIAIVISVILTYVIINFIPFSNMLDSFKISFKTETMNKVVKYYSLTLVTITIIIYTILYFGIHEIIKFVCEKLKYKE